ncbi:MAG: ADP-ribosylglycohydrolase family protein [Methanobrevibacter sp.]|uniref:ADP-ribosylglycohydrolase family protein n=1 Tax=Methanobrevibacter sp. TaxID=66852 RepID=UPI0025EC3297|nr:ADP-ribosylglycohydrolase family protein [Methanobrevibacter sp.]MBQ8018049.1 ADP-ribosylglycohydrolase family protein [Methanobrevibacter sp.]MBR1610085.1 ADP-ribosylglycohydrolase family protein [Methanobrevibacter sp.]
MKGIIGAIAGDIIGSVYERYAIKTKKFELFAPMSTFTDDTVLTLAVANWLLEDKTSKGILSKNLRKFASTYPDAGYGRSFNYWIYNDSADSYGSWSNGSAMRVSPCAWVADSLEESQNLSKMSAIVTHSHPEGIKGAQATSDAIFLARIGSTKEEIKNHIESTYEYDLSRSLDEIRPDYDFELACAKSVPESIICFLEANDYEDAIRNAISLGGDADTQAAIAGSIASAYWEIPQEIYDKAISYLDENLISVLNNFNDKFM